MQSPDDSGEVIIEGRIIPQDYVQLSFSIPGQNSEVLVMEGQAVEAGQVIARLRGVEQAEAVDKTAEFELLNAQQSLQALSDNHEAVLNEALVSKKWHAGR